MNDGPIRPEGRHRRGTPGYRRLIVALFCAGIATFAQLYSPQSVLPTIALSLGITPHSAALTISVSTGALAVGIFPWMLLASRLGRAQSIAVAVAGRPSSAA